jgi:hypothetical protein
MIIAKEIGQLDNGARYIIMQDEHHNCHVTVSHEDKHIYDCFIVRSAEELKINIYNLSKELFEDLTSSDMGVIISESKLLSPPLTIEDNLND